jgi:hypothetical protein
LTGPESRNDSTHFPAANGRGHRRRKVVNLPAEYRFEMDPYERRALQLIGEIDQWLLADQARVERMRRAQGVERSGDPGE